MSLTRLLVQSITREREKKHRPFPALIFQVLNNPVRRILDPPWKLIDKLGFKKTDTVMDFGCGPGFFTLELAKRAKTVVAVDISDKMLSKAKNMVSKKQDSFPTEIKFIQSDGQHLNLPDSFADRVFLGYVFREVNHKVEVLSELRRVLRPNGQLIIVERTKLGLNIFGLPLVKPSEIIEYLCDARFKNIDLVQYGTSAIIRGIKLDNIKG